MKAIVCTRYGSAERLQFQEVEKPVPKEGEVLIRVRAATVTAGDVALRKLPALIALPIRLIGIQQQKIPGIEFAGEVEAVGKNVKGFRPGDQVFGTTTGLRFGANAEYVCVPAEPKTGVLAIKPLNMPYEEAAAVPVGAMTALFLLKKAAVQPGQSVLVFGASGSVGTYAVQLARHFGANVTGVCSTANLELVKSLGADTVIDYTQEDFSQTGHAYDVIFDAVGKQSASRSKGALKDGGVFLSVRSTTREKVENLIFLKELIEAGKIKPVIDRCYPLAQTVEAHRYVETGRKKGNVVIAVAA